MKTILYSLLLICCATVAEAQNPSFSPASFTAEDQVTITIDVTGTNMAGATEAYIWIFSNPDIGGGNNGIVNGEWGASSNDAKMVSAGANKWTFTFTGTILFGRPPAELKSFGFLLKKKDGSAQTPDYKPFAFDPLVFVPSMLRVFPAKVSENDIVTVNFDRSHGATPTEQRMQPVSATITMYNEDGDPVGDPLTINVRVFAPNIWAASFNPAASFTPGAGHSLNKFKYKFNGTVLDPNGATISVSSSEAEVSFTAMK
jgi:hypothetical protein